MQSSGKIGEVKTSWTDLLSSGDKPITLEINLSFTLDDHVRNAKIEGTFSKGLTIDKAKQISLSEFADAVRKREFFCDRAEW